MERYYRNSAWSMEAAIAGNEEPYYRSNSFFTWADARTVRHCIRAGKPLGALGKDGVAPLHHAALNKNPAVVEALIKAGADPKARNDYGKLPIDFIDADSPLYGTDVYWALHQASYD